MAPACTDDGTATAAIGRSACSTAPLALAMPAPQVAVVQLHSLVCKSVAPVGTWHIGTLGSLDTGNGCAPACKRVRSCAGVRLPLTASIKPAMPETMGAEKLVPTLKLVSSVYVLVSGTVVPVLVVVSIENRHGGPVFTQLPPGALTATSGPRLLKPTLVPSCRSPATPTAPGQLAGESTGPPSLPAATTTSTPALPSSLTIC